jgi:hypothetical protein
VFTSSTAGPSLSNPFRTDLDSRSKISQPPAGSRNNRADSAPAASGDASYSFAAQLANAIQGYLKGPGSGSAPLEIEITPQIGQNVGGDSGSRQFVVTVREASAGSSTVPSTPAAFPTLSETLKSITTQPEAPPAATPSADSDKPVYANEADAYWATQPAAVQALRAIPNEADRTAKAQELSQQGYAIDVPIMLWNLDPLAIMKVRQAGGMTWIPAMGQDAPQTGPGINFPGMRPYDPAHPAPGSLPVSTDWARGLEDTSPWVNLSNVVAL